MVYDSMGRLERKNSEKDVEAQALAGKLTASGAAVPGASEPPSPAPPTAYTQAFWLIIWTANNIFVTLINKMAFAHVDFNYPYALSAVHMACNSVGAMLYLHYHSATVKTKVLSPQGQRLVYAFSLLFAANIAVGNNSLRYVSVNFNQVMRSLVPGVTMMLGMLWLNKSFSFARKSAVVPIMMGVAMACFGELRYTWLGFAVTVLCVILAALKVVLSGELLTGDLKLHPVDMLGRMAPLSLGWIGICCVASGELTAISARWDELSQGYALPVVLISGVASFSLNICSLFANKLTSPLTLTITANVKQVLMIAISTMIFNTPITFWNGLGIVVVLIGSARYSYVSYFESQVIQQRARASVV